MLLGLQFDGGPGYENIQHISKIMPTCIVGLIFLFYRERELGKKNFLEREDAFFFMVYFPHFHQIYIY